MSMTGYEQAQIGLGSASLINEAFGNPLKSGSVNWRGKYYRNQMQDRLEYEPGLTAANTRAAARNNIIGKVSGAKKAGLHPLFAMGAAGGGAGSPSFSIPGQSERGDFKADGLIAALGGMADRRNDIAMQQLMASALKIAENTTSNDQAQKIEGLDPKTQEYEKGKFQAFNKRHPEQSMDVLSPMKKFRVGSQHVWLPIEDMDSLMEDPAAVVAAAALYHGNKNIDWPMFYQEYRRGSFSTPRQTTQGTKNMFKRIRAHKRKSARKYKGSEQFFPYSRGPHR